MHIIVMAQAVLVNPLVMTTAGSSVKVNQSDSLASRATQQKSQSHNNNTSEPGVMAASRPVSEMSSSSSSSESSEESDERDLSCSSPGTVSDSSANSTNAQDLSGPPSKKRRKQSSSKGSKTSGFSQEYKRCLKRLRNAVQALVTVGYKFRKPFLRVNAIVTDHNAKVLVVGSEDTNEAVARSSAAKAIIRSLKPVEQLCADAAVQQKDVVVPKAAIITSFVFQPVATPADANGEGEKFRKIGKDKLLSRLSQCLEQLEGPGIVYRAKYVPHYWPRDVPFEQPKTLAIVRRHGKNFKQTSSAIRHILTHIYAKHGYGVDGHRLSDDEKKELALTLRYVKPKQSTGRKRKGQHGGNRRRPPPIADDHRSSPMLLSSVRMESTPATDRRRPVVCDSPASIAIYSALGSGVVQRVSGQ